MWDSGRTRTGITKTKKSCNKILKTETASKFGLYQQFDEKTDCIVSVCPILAKEQYIKRHDRVCTQLHVNMCKELRLKLDKEHWYKHVTKSSGKSKKAR
jgi:hypothetical protein